MVGIETRATRRSEHEHHHSHGGWVDLDSQRRKGVRITELHVVDPYSEPPNILGMGGKGGAQRDRKTLGGREIKVFGP